jgi:serine/threonine protein kinase
MGSETNEDWLLTPGTRLGHYEILRLAGRGGMAAVYEGRHVAIGKRVAIKTLTPEVAAKPGAGARFLREAQLTSRARHPHIVDVTDMGTDAGQTYLVMEYLEGEDLEARLVRGRLTVEETIDIALPVVAAVAAAHAEGIIHRDLKPGNVFLARSLDGVVVPKVLDFGISKPPDDIDVSAASADRFVGSLSYVAPEQILDAHAASAASDQHALGVLFYECLAGQTPYPGTSIYRVFQSIVAGAHPSLASCRPDIPTELEAVVARAMSRQAADRFASVIELGRALLAFASPKMRLLWEDTFAADGAASGATLSGPPPAGAAPPAMVIEPAQISSSVRLAPTVSYASPLPRRAARTTSSIPAPGGPAFPFVPRPRPRAWAAAAMTLAILVATAGSLTGRGSTPPVGLARATAAEPAAPRVVLESPSSAPTAVPARAPGVHAELQRGRSAHGRATHSRRFGRNGAPLID